MNKTLLCIILVLLMFIGIATLRARNSRYSWIWDDKGEAESVVAASRLKFGNYFSTQHAADMALAMADKKQQQQQQQQQQHKNKNKKKKLEASRLCIGVSTMLREGDGADYMYMMLASLLAPLDAKQRQNIDIRLSAGDVYQENVAVKNVSAYVDSYAELTSAQRAERKLVDIEHRLAKLSAPKAMIARARTRGRIDYARAIEGCVGKRGSYGKRDGDVAGPDYVLVLEDDVVASSDWYDRAVETMDAVDRDIAADSEPFRRVFFFYTEHYQGYSGAPEFLLHVAIVGVLGTLSTLAIVLMVEYYRVIAAMQGMPPAMLPVASKSDEFLPSGTERPLLAYWVWPSRRDAAARRQRFNASLRFALTVLALWLIAAALVLKMTGRTHVLPEPSRGLHKTEYNKYKRHGELCCAQAIMYDAKSARDLVEAFYDPPKQRPCDMALLHYEQSRRSAPYFIYPPIFEHIGYRPAYNKTTNVKLASGARYIV